MKTFNWSLGLLTAGIILIITDVILRIKKPSAEKIATVLGLTGTGLIITGIIMLFSIKNEIKIA